MLLISTQLHRRLVIWASPLTIQMALCRHGFSAGIGASIPLPVLRKLAGHLAAIKRFVSQR
jgi:hypothetical protein